MKRIFTIISIVICVFALAWLFLVPAAFGLLKPFVAEQIRKQYGYVIQDENLTLKTSFLPYFNISAKNIEIINPDKFPIIKVVAPPS